MVENQNIEFKSVWKDEWIKWVCGMANAGGGIIYIGKDDNGNVVGVENAIKLVKDIPNVIKDSLGIIPDVKIEEDGDKLYIVIKVDDYPMPISYKGVFYLRSGSNNNIITGTELDRFMLEKVGRKWEDLPVKEATFDDLSEEAIKTFKESAISHKRLNEEDVNVSDDILLKNLGLYDGKYLNKACMLLFGEDPNKWALGSYIKIGCFGENDADLKYQDEVTGPLILQIDKAIRLIYMKYLKGLIHYEGIERIDEYIIPREAFREIILNSVNHKQYEECNPIQISIYDDKIYIYNDGKFPEEINSKNVYDKHYSKPYNPLIAQTFFRAGFIESWGRGFEKIASECESVNVPLPEVNIMNTGVMIKCTPSDTYMEVLNEMRKEGITSDYQIIENDDLDSGDNDVSIKNTNNDVKLEDIELKILDEINKNKYITQKELGENINLSERTVWAYITEMKDKNIIKRKGSKKSGYWIITK